MSARGQRDVADRLASDLCGNFVWLCEFERTDAALEVAVVPSGLGRALAQHFGIVHQVATSAELLAQLEGRAAEDRIRNLVPARGEPAHLAFPDASFDCLTLHGVLDAQERHRPGAASERAVDLAILREARRVLRPGGWLQVAVANPLRLSTLRRPGEVRRLPGVVHRARGAFIEAAGFREVRRFHVFPHHELPRVVIPDDRDAARAFERNDQGSAGHARARRLAARTPFYPMLVPSLLYLARA